MAVVFVVLATLVVGAAVFGYVVYLRMALIPNCAIPRSIAKTKWKARPLPEGYIRPVC
jgi:hypothetical protein